MVDLNDVSAERAVLAGICKFNQDAFFDVADIVNTKTFTVDSNQIIYRCLQQILENVKQDEIRIVDYPAILSAAKTLGLDDFFTKRTEQDHLRAIFNMPVKLENVRGFAQKIRKLEIAREAIEVADYIGSTLKRVNGTEPISNILSLLETPVFDFVTSLVNIKSGPVNIATNSEEYFKFLSENKRTVIGISTGFPQYDKAIGGGLRRKTVNLIAGRLKTGKSSISNNVGLHVAEKLKIPTLYVDTEMSREDQLHRAAANLSNYTINEIESGNFDISIIEPYRKRLEQIPLDYENVAGASFEEILNIIRRWIFKKVGFNDNGLTNDCLVIYDYFKLMNTDGLDKVAEYQKLGFQISQLHDFAVKYDIPILTFAQLNRDGISKEDTSIISGSDRIGWICSNISIFKVKTDEEIAEDGLEAGNRKLIPIACRHGPGLPFGQYISMKMDGAHCRVQEVIVNKDNNNLHKEDELVPF